ncbi:hypothetical protein [Chryseobacterium flavum]|uniref:hypothetical protein n=1 Tax=Chryseobacterium flavum TaxID=415851 RepID=UPI0028AE18D6|nr:hypothetical protein [Chryseobacterium flavum]
MTKLENKIGISIGVIVIILLFLMSIGNEIEVLNRGKIFTSNGIGEGVFYSMADFLTYNVFIVGCVLSILYLLFFVKSLKK